MIKNLSLLVLFSMLVALVDSTAGLRFKADSKRSYAEFTGWPMPEISELQFYFKTGSKKPAILLYQDNGVDRDTNDYLEVSLVKHGHVRLRLRGNGCSKTYLYIRRNFTDDSWHKLKISRHGVRLNLTVDNISSEYISCVQPPRFSGRNGKAQSSLFMGGIPLENPQGTPTDGKWALTGLFRKVLQESSWFQGCVALLRYNSEAKPFENVKLLGSKGVWENCSGEACSSSEQNKCKHGGICVDLVVKTECDCKGTGYYGRFCERSVSQELTTTSDVRNTAFTTAPDHTKPDKDNENDEKNPDETKGEPTARKNKKARNESSSPVVSPGWCLLLSMGSLLMRTTAA